MATLSLQLEVNRSTKKYFQCK